MGILVTQMRHDLFRKAFLGLSRLEQALIVKASCHTSHTRTLSFSCPSPQTGLLKSTEGIVSCVFSLPRPTTGTFVCCVHLSPALLEWVNEWTNEWNADIWCYFRDTPLPLSSIPAVPIPAFPIPQISHYNPIYSTIPTLISDTHFSIWNDQDKTQSQGHHVMWWYNQQIIRVKIKTCRIHLGRSFEDLFLLGFFPFYFLFFEIIFVYLLLLIIPTPPFLV